MTDSGGHVEWLNVREMSAWRAFVETIHDLMRSLETDLARDGLTLGDYQVLVYLAEAPHPMRMSDLAARLQLTPSGLTRRLDGLVRSGDVERLPDATDRRAMQAWLTPAGRKRLREIAPRHVRSVRTNFLEPIGDDDLDAIARAFLAIREHLNGEARGTPRSPGEIPTRNGPRR